MNEIENDLLGILEHSLLGNAVRDWLVALGIAVITLVLLYLVKRLSLSRLTALAKQTENTWDDSLADLLSRTRNPFIFIVALFLGSLFLSTQ